MIAKPKPARELAARALCRKAGNPEDSTFEGRPMWESYLPEVDVVIEALIGRTPDTDKGYGRYAVIVSSTLGADALARKLERAKAEFGSMVASIMGIDGLYVFGVVTDWYAGEIFDLLAGPGIHVAVLSVGTEVAIPNGKGDKFLEMMRQVPRWKSRRGEDW